MPIFASEAEMQKWLSDCLANCCGLSELISNSDYLDSFIPTSLAEQRVFESYNTCLTSLHVTELISQNENISIDSQDILKPDFILYAPETEGIVIVELKNIPGPTRQAGTELAAYSCEIKSSIPFISDGDIVNVLVSTEWPTLLKHYIFHQTFWQRKNIICLEPHIRAGVIQLKLLDIAALSQSHTSFRISEKHIGGYQICLYDDELYTERGDRSRLDKYVEQMKSALHAMAVRGNSHNNHGFAFLWKDNWSLSLAPYSITLLNFAPFQSIERFLHIEDADLPGVVERFMKISDEHFPIGHGNSLSEITDYGNRFLKNFCSPMAEGFTYWGALRDIMLQRADLIAFEAWGMFGEVFAEELAAEYERGNFSCSVTSPELGLMAIEELIDQDYDFIDLAGIGFGEEADSDEQESL